MAYGDFTDLAKRTVADKFLRDKAFNIAKSPKYDGYQRGLASMVYTFFDKKKTAGTGVTTLENKSVIKYMPQNKQLAEELQEPIVKKFKKTKMYSAFKDNIWGADLADVQLIIKDLDFYYVLSIIEYC